MRPIRYQRAARLLNALQNREEALLTKGDADAAARMRDRILDLVCKQPLLPEEVRE